MIKEKIRTTLCHSCWLISLRVHTHGYFFLSRDYGDNVQLFTKVFLQHLNEESA